MHYFRIINSVLFNSGVKYLCLWCAFFLFGETGFPTIIPYFEGRDSTTKCLRISILLISSLSTIEYDCILGILT